jgi:transcriptional regulator with XRE-family HTH domain
MARLEILRRQRLLSQRELAERAGVAESTVHLIEVGRTRPRFRVVRAICEALGVQPAEVDEFRPLIELERREVAA